jgi:amino acid adenylation domain-containing protein
MLMGNSAEAIVAMLGILKAGHPFLPLDPDVPYNRLREMIVQSDCALLVSEKKFIRTLNSLQWDCTCLSGYLCVDSADVRGEVEPLNEKMKIELWNYVGETAVDAITGGGWFSSFTGEPFSAIEMEEFAGNGLLKLKPFLGSSTRVLEIGCASGLTMFKLAPLVKEYVGTDLSPVIIENTARQLHAQGHRNIKLKALPADEIHTLDEGGFDVIVFNSVVHNFNGLNYLRNVLGQCLRKLSPGGIIFLGDIMDNDKKGDLVGSLMTYRAMNPSQPFRPKIDWSNELFISRGFFADLAHELPEIASVEVSEKIRTVENELTRFRYDVILRVDQTRSTRPALPPRTKFQYGAPDLAREPGTPPAVEVKGDDAACIIYTSGSTGTPKGVLVPHRAIANYAAAITGRYQLSCEDATVLVSRYAYDIVYTSIWGALLAGGRLHVLDDAFLKDPDKICQVVEEEGITFLKVTPSLFNMMLFTVKNQQFTFPALQRVFIGGEPIRGEDVLDFFERYGHCSIVNHYGPTETTIGVLTHEIFESTAAEFCKRPVVGKPIANVEAYVLDKHGQVLPPNVKGELHLAGACLAAGYINDPELTHQRFLPGAAGRKLLYRTGDLARQLPDGTIQLFGRADDQVKIRGYRAELGEIERIIGQYPEVTRAAVAMKGTGQNTLLAGYYQSGGELDPSHLRAFCREYLPEQLVPACFVRVERFGLTSSGKTDRKALPDPEAIRPSRSKGHIAPRNPIEQQLVAMWAEVLGKEDISVNDNFFEIGGHSLKATQLMSRIYKELNASVKLRTIFANPTVEMLSKEIEIISWLHESGKNVEADSASQIII